MIDDKYNLHSKKQIRLSPSNHSLFQSSSVIYVYLLFNLISLYFVSLDLGYKFLKKIDTINYEKRKKENI